MKKVIKKTEERRYMEKNYDCSGCGDDIRMAHRGKEKGYSYNETPKSDEQRVKDSIARHNNKNK